MRVRTLLMVLALVFAAVPQSAAALSKDAKQEVANLQQQLNALGDEYVALDATRASIVAEEQRLKDVDELLKGAVARYKRNAEERNQRITAQQAEVVNHNGRCSGTFSDRNFVAQCNAEAAQLNARKAQLIAEVETGRQMKQGLEERIQGLSQGTLEWAQKVKAHNGKLEDLNGRRQVFLNRINAVLEDLKTRERISVSCVGMADLESAHRCLQRVWDGAK